jgi:uncharacterized membrane protein
MSTDGEVVIGYAGFPVPNIHYEVWRWTAAGGMQTLPLAGAPSRFPSGISGDGSRIVGRTLLCSASLEPGCNPGWLWTATGGYEALQAPPGVNASAGGISRDGVVVVGMIGPVPGAAWRPYRWQSNTPVGDFGTSPSVGLAVAGSPSADGTVVVGSHNIAGQWYSWIWKENLGLWDLGAFLQSHGAPGFPGWSWPQPSDLSDDGRVVIGNGYMPGGNSAGWVAFIDGDCYADCNGSWHLTIADFACFQNRFVAGDPYADCNADTQLTVADFLCYQSEFVAGCP